MKIYRILLALLALSLLTCLAGVQGQYQYPTTSTSTTSTSMASTTAASAPTPIPAPQYTSQYAGYYNMTSGPVPGNIVSPTAPLRIGNTPSMAYTTPQMQATPNAQYQSAASYSTELTLWVQGTTNWTTYAVVPVGSTVQLLTTSPNGGNGYITDNEPDGLQYSQFFYFYPRSQLPFYATQAGRHVLTISIGNQISNPVTIEVTGYYYYYPGYYYPSYYRGYRNYYGYYSNYYGNYFGNYYGNNFGYYRMYNNMYGNYGYGNYGGYGRFGYDNYYGY